LQAAEKAKDMAQTGFSRSVQKAVFRLLNGSERIHIPPAAPGCAGGHTLSFSIVAIQKGIIRKTPGGNSHSQRLERRGFAATRRVLPHSSAAGFRTFHGSVAGQKCRSHGRCHSVPPDNSVFKPA
jgi:hypothetical protein